MAKKLWGGRFKKETDRDFEEFSKSIHYDYRFAEFDIGHSLTHIVALYEAGILTRLEYRRLSQALNAILKDVKQGKFTPGFASEDIHTDIQNKVERKVGRLAMKLHSLRSRNDQVVFDEKWYCYREAVGISNLLSSLVISLVALARKHIDQFFIGYTHTQRAQVISLSHYLSAFCQMFARDVERLRRYSDNLFIYVGAGALAGTSLSKEDYNKAINEFLSIAGFRRVKLTENALDNVSDRDFIMEFLSVLSIIQMHLSRLAEDFILYSTKEFDFLVLPEEFCTGSSLMPHKKNPDFLELVRGNTGRIYGNLFSVLTTMKSLPLTYNRDMQLDKEPLFSSVETLRDELKIMAKFIKKIKLNKDEINRALEDESLYATELSEFLVYKGVAFRVAHNIVGKLIRHSQDKRVKIKDMPDKLLKTFHKELNQKDIHKIMKPKYAVSSKKSVPTGRQSVSRKLPKVKPFKNK